MESWVFDDLSFIFYQIGPVQGSYGPGFLFLISSKEMKRHMSGFC